MRRNLFTQVNFHSCFKGASLIWKNFHNPKLGYPICHKALVLEVEEPKSQLHALILCSMFYVMDSYWILLDILQPPKRTLAQCTTASVVCSPLHIFSGQLLFASQTGRHQLRKIMCEQLKLCNAHPSLIDL